MQYFPQSFKRASRDQCVNDKMSKHGVEVLKKQLRGKITDFQNDSKSVKAHLDSDESIQARLKQCEDKLTTKLEG